MFPFELCFEGFSSCAWDSLICGVEILYTLALHDFYYCWGSLILFAVVL